MAVTSQFQNHKYLRFAASRVRFLATSIALGFLCALGAPWIPAAIFVVLLSALAAILIATTRHLSGIVDPFHPLLAFGLPFLLYTAIGFAPVSGYVESFGVNVPSHLVIYYAVGFSAFFLAAVCASRLARRPARPDESPDGWRYVRTLVIIVALLSSGCVAFLMTYVSVGYIPALAPNPDVSRFAFRPPPGVGPLLSALLICALIALMLSIKKGDSRYVGAAVVGACLILLYGLQIRTYLFEFLIAALVIVHFRVRPLRFAQLVPISAIAIAAALGFAAIRSMDLYGGNAFALSAALSRQTGLSIQFDSVGNTVFAMVALAYTQARHTVDTFAVWDQVMAGGNYFWGALTAADWSTLLPGRRPDSGALTISLVSDYGWPIDTPQPPGIVGAYFGEGGLVGVIFGMSVVGVGLQVLYESAARMPTEDVVLTYGVVLAYAVASIYGMGLIGPSIALPILIIGAAGVFARTRRWRLDGLVAGLSACLVVAFIAKVLVGVGS